MGQMEHGRPYPRNMLRLCIDGYENADIYGRIFSQLKAETLYFNNIGELLLKADHLFDEIGFPQMFQKKRSFGKPIAAGSYTPNPGSPADSIWVYEQKGEESTYDILIQSRNKTSWQGLYRYSESENWIAFESELDFFKAISKNVKKEMERDFYAGDLCT